MARQHYLTLAKNVDIPGTDKDDRFEVIRKNDQQTIVSVYPFGQDQPYYQRTFLENETTEIRLYGLEGNDYFKLEGNTGKGINILVIGGKGKDSINNQSMVKSPGKQTRIYDLKKNNHCPYQPGYTG